jgi:LuxR family maltose regulon positive regulatory protein
VTLNLGIAYLNQRRLVEAEQALVETEHTGQESDNLYARLIALTFLGIIKVVLGKLHQGKEFFEQAIQSGGNSPAVALAHLNYGALLYEWNDLNAAADHLQRGLTMSQRGGNPEVQIGAYRTLALLKQAQGDASAARTIIDEAHQYAREHKLPAIMRAAIAANHVQIALAQDDLETAVHWIEQITPPADASPFYPTLGLARARLLIAQKQYSAASAELAHCFESVARVGWEGGLIAVRVLQSLAAKTKQARLEFLIDALKRAQPEGYIRTFADASEALLPLLQDVALEGTLPEYVGKIMAAIKQKPSAPTQSLIEPLSEREIEVLRLVAAGLSNLEIAKKLVLSEGTVKTHVHNIYGKLDAQNRTQAIARAREGGII